MAACPADSVVDMGAVNMGAVGMGAVDMGEITCTPAAPPHWKPLEPSAA